MNMKKVIVLIGLTTMLFACNDNNNKHHANVKSIEVADTLYSFFGHQIVMKESVNEQIAAVAKQEKNISFDGKVIEVAGVKWGINIHNGTITLFSSVSPDSPKIKAVVQYLNSIYGKPYESNEEENDWKWSSSKKANELFQPGSTLVHLRWAYGEERGTMLVFQ